MRELPKAIPLLTPNREQVGYMLLAVKADGLGSYVGECVFMMMPQNAAVIESDLGVVISELKVAGEHSCRVSVSDERIEVVVTPESLPVVSVVHDPRGDSPILTSWGGSERQIGVAGLQ